MGEKLNMSVFLEVGVQYILIPRSHMCVVFLFPKWWDSIQKHDYSLWMGKKANAPADWENAPWHSSFSDLWRPILHRWQFWQQHPVFTTTLVCEDNSKCAAEFGFSVVGEACCIMFAFSEVSLSSCAFRSELDLQPPSGPDVTCDEGQDLTHTHFHVQIGRACP